MQFAIVGVATSTNTNLKGYGYNSAGLSDESLKMLKGYTQHNVGNIHHLYQPNDVVFKIGNQMGCYYSISTTRKHLCKAHSLKHMRANIAYSGYVEFI